MSPEQITMLLNIVSDLPMQALLVIAVYRMYNDIRDALTKRLQWHSDQLSLYMERDRDIVASLVSVKVETASKYSRVPTNGNPPVPG